MRHYHITKHEKGWQLKQAKADRALFIAGTKEEAVKKAAAWARANASDADPIKVKIFGLNGSIKDELTYPRLVAPKAAATSSGAKHKTTAANGTKELDFAGISSEGATQLASVLTRLKRYDEGR